MFIILHDFEPMLKCTQEQWILEHPPLKDKLLAPQSHQGPRCQFNGRVKLPSLTPWILFYSEGKKKMVDADDNPMGQGQKAYLQCHRQAHFCGSHQVWCCIPSKFCNSVSNQISGLRTKYKKHKGRFMAMGTGIMPHNGQSVQNLLDLDSIWHNNPSMAAKTYSSQLGIDHAGTLYSLVQLHGRAVH
ncbi:hypothetical protein BDR05DRAFT_954028 [Suillus weaverae]|nr:hypothetical protein BDR05DRAFT_954028 [Suillus weaverae]